MQEEINRKTIVLTVTAVKLTGRVLAKLLRAAVKAIQKRAAEPPHGKQTVKQLARQNAGMQNIEITDQNIKGFERTARKYGVDFALKRDDSQFPPKWMVFFKGRDADALTAAFKEFSRKELQKQQRPSLREKLLELTEQARNAMPEPIKNKEHGEPVL